MLEIVFVVFQTSFIQGISKGILDGIRRPQRKFFWVVAESEKVIKHIQETKHKGAAFKTIKSLMILMVNQVLIN